MKHLFNFINIDPASTRSEFVFFLSLLFDDAANLETVQRLWYDG
jgi:hypothetical protein